MTSPGMSPQWPTLGRERSWTAASSVDSRRGTVDSSAGTPRQWALMEVGKGTKGASVSPSIPLLRSNRSTPVLPKAEEDKENWDTWDGIGGGGGGGQGGGQGGGDHHASSYGGRDRDSRPFGRAHKGAWADEQMEGEEELGPKGRGDGDGITTHFDETAEEGGFDASCFVGEWQDSLGHHVSVLPVETQGRRRQSRGRKLAFSAWLQKMGLPDKRLALSKGRDQKWMCGNAEMVADESSYEKIVWRTTDGRTSSWSRAMPEGCVYFDPPPAWDWGSADQNVAPQLLPYSGGPAAGPVYWMDSSGMLHEVADAPIMNISNELHQVRISCEDDDDESPEERAARARRINASAPQSQAVVSASAHAASVVAFAGDVGKELRPAALEFVPSAAPVPRALPLLELVQGDGLPHPDVSVGAPGRIEWALPEVWGNLNRFPRDFCLSSPMFGLGGSIETSMQLVFYPNGRKEADSTCCSLAMTRGPASDGMKFEFLINNRSSGPKVCLGRRYVSDFPKPIDDSEENKAEKVVIVMQIHELLGKNAA